VGIRVENPKGHHDSREDTGDEQRGLLVAIDQRVQFLFAAARRRSFGRRGFLSERSTHFIVENGSAHKLDFAVGRRRLVGFVQKQDQWKNEGEDECHEVEHVAVAQERSLRY